MAKKLIMYSGLVLLIIGVLVIFGTLASNILGILIASDLWSLAALDVAIGSGMAIAGILLFIEGRRT